MGDRVSVTEVVDAPAEVLYALISDLPRMGDWSPESMGGRWLMADGPRVGARFVGRNRTGHRRWSTLATITVADPGRRLAFRVTAPLVRIADWEYTLNQVESGCRVEETFVDRRWRLIKRISTLRTGVADRPVFNCRSMQQTLAALKTEAERVAAQNTS